MSESTQAFRLLDTAFRDGDMATLRDELGGRDGFPNVIAHPALGWCLMLAVVTGHHDVARMLVRAGADLSITGTGSPGFAAKTAADLAEARADLRLATYIRSRT